MAGSRTVKGFQSPNNTIRVGVVGCGGRGGSHVNAWSRMENVQIVALSDIDESHIGDKVKALESRGAKTPNAFVDFRKMLDDKSIDAISIATPNHWHTLQTIWACRPARTSTSRSRARTTSSSRSRSSPPPGSTTAWCSTAARAARRLRCRKASSGCARASSATSTWPGASASSGATPSARRRSSRCRRASTTTCGPGRRRSATFTKNRFHYNWHWFWDTGNGDIGNQGIHEVDIARWGLGVTHPTKVSAIGGKFMFDDDQETPNTINANFEFDVDGKKKMMTFEVRHWI